MHIVKSFAAALALGVVGSAVAQVPQVSAGLGNSNAADIVGTWLVDVTRTDCTTGQPTAGPFKAIVVFHAGGTLSEQGAPVNGRTPSFGQWFRTAPNRYVANSVFLSYGPAPAYAYAARQEIRRNVELSADGQTWIADVRAITYTAAGGETVGCVTGVGTRWN
jgi:hypothetical protein